LPIFRSHSQIEASPPVMANIVKSLLRHYQPSQLMADIVVPYCAAFLFDETRSQVPLAELSFI